MIKIILQLIAKCHSFTYNHVRWMNTGFADWVMDTKCSMYTDKLSSATEL